MWREFLWASQLLLLKKDSGNSGCLKQQNIWKLGQGDKAISSTAWEHSVIQNLIWRMHPGITRPKEIHEVPRKRYCSPIYTCVKILLDIGSRVSHPPPFTSGVEQWMCSITVIHLASVSGTFRNMLEEHLSFQDCSFCAFSSQQFPFLLRPLLELSSGFIPLVNFVLFLCLYSVFLYC